MSKKQERERLERLIMKNYIEEFEKTKEKRREFINIIYDSARDFELDYYTIKNLVSKVNTLKIKTKEELKKEIQKEELLKIVDKKQNLDYKSQRELKFRVKNNIITTKEELKKEITEEINKNEEIINRKKELLKIVDKKQNLDYKSQRELKFRVKNNIITTKEELKKEIENEKRKTEYRKIVNEEPTIDDTSRWKL